MGREVSVGWWMEEPREKGEGRKGVEEPVGFTFNFLGPGSMQGPGDCLCGCG